MKISVIAAFSVSVLLAAAAAELESVTPCPTTSATPVYDDDLGCWAISVEHDATYCIDGPICSGSGASPAGTLCPVKGDVAIADCHSYLKSYAGNDSCVLPVDATCQVIKTGAWGCVLSGSATPAPTTSTGSSEEEVTPAPTKTCNGECEETPTPCPTKTTTTEPTVTTTPCPTSTKASAPIATTTPRPTTTKAPTPTATTIPCPGCTAEPTTKPTTKPCPTCTEAPTPTPTSHPTPTPTACTGNCTHSGSGSFYGNGSYVGNNTIKAETTEATSSSSGVSAGVIGAIAAVAAVVAVVAGAAIYKQYTKKLDAEEAAQEHYHVDVVTP
ncbi:unnamed protein product [Phytophthora fragariaefolia]|uniref:Unnamed protein product n=1 Tax=Phytophthora fragariaefolia TaxID=1490495 RepID=A0A9W6YAL1_9STRA|nr:unnamed protein product [Phytophthora fragariaefolia]